MLCQKNRSKKLCLTIPSSFLTKFEFWHSSHNWRCIMSTRYCKYSMYRSLLYPRVMTWMSALRLSYSRFYVKNTLWGRLLHCNNLPRVNLLHVIVTTYPSYIYHCVELKFLFMVFDHLFFFKFWAYKAMYIMQNGPTQNEQRSGEPSWAMSGKRWNR